MENDPSAVAAELSDFLLAPQQNAFKYAGRALEMNRVKATQLQLKQVRSTSMALSDAMLNKPHTLEALERSPCPGLWRR
jgi:hypothetical protein